MFQPRVKLEFVRRYCAPTNGWMVFVDIDASEEGRTGGERSNAEARARRREMEEDGKSVRAAFQALKKVTVGGNRADWFRVNGLPPIAGDRDIVAFNLKQRLYVIAEVEGASSGQPEQKLYKAMGQIVMAASDPVPNGWERRLVLVVHGTEISRHVKRARALKELKISAVALANSKDADDWLFHSALPPT